MIGRVIVTAIIAKRKLPGVRFKLQFDRPTLRQMIGFTGKIAVIRINAVIYNQMDKAIIAVMLISTLLTDYDIANKIHALVLTGLSLISSLVMPTASDLFAREHRLGLQELFIKATKYTAALCLPITIATMILAGPLIYYWIGPEYAYNAGITRLFLVYLLFTALTPVGVNMMIGMDRFGPLLTVLVVATAINLLVSIVAARFIGVAGVILGTLVGNILVWYPYLRHILRTLSISWRDFLRRVVLRTYPLALLCGLALFVAVHLRTPASLLEVAIFAGVDLALYGLLFLLFGLETAERQMFTGIIRRRIQGQVS
jgi:O-antigen/teichoic acid export membrane protein